MRELVHAIDTHMEMVDLEVTSNLHAEEGQRQTLAANQPTGSATACQTVCLTFMLLHCVYLLFI